MTSILQSAMPRVSSFDQPIIHSSSYSDLASLEASMQFLDKSEPKSPYIHSEFEKNYPSSAPSSAPSSPTYAHFSRQESYSSTPASSLSLDHGDNNCDDDGDDDEEENLDTFVSYQQASTYDKSPHLDPSPTDDDVATNSTQSPPGDDKSVLPEKTSDDQSLEAEPTRHVDYLSHEWKEEDIWSSWRYIVARRKKITNSVRLENASWRTWMKAKNNLKTVSPETLNWLKDCDVTWLYGPLQPDTKRSLAISHSQPASRMSTSSSFISRKPILKKKSASAAILERSRSQQSLLQRASEIIRVQQSSPAHNRPILRRTRTDFTLPSYTGSSVLNTPAEFDTPGSRSQRYSFNFPEAPTPADQKHVMFDQEVRQVQAIESDEDEKEDEYEAAISESDEDDDGGLMMALTRSRTSSRGTPRGSFSCESKTIVPLPSTTLKYRVDTPEPPQGDLKPHFWPPPSNTRLSPSPSQETLRPSRPSHNFLIDDDPEVSDEPWTASKGPGYSPYDDENEPGPNMRRTASGMFMPYDENEEQDTVTNNTLFGQAMYAVNTFKDIAHVVWNVGWTRK